MTSSQLATFRGWLMAALEENIQTRFLPWLQSFAGWKVVNAPIWDNDGVRCSVFTTMTPEVTAAKQTAIAASGVGGVVINDDNMGSTGLMAFNQMDIDLAHSQGSKSRLPDFWRTHFRRCGFD